MGDNNNMALGEKADSLRCSFCGTQWPPKERFLVCARCDEPTFPLLKNEQEEDTSPEMSMEEADRVLGRRMNDLRADVEYYKNRAEFEKYYAILMHERGEKYVDDDNVWPDIRRCYALADRYSTGAGRNSRARKTGSENV